MRGSRSYRARIQRQRRVERAADRDEARFLPRPEPPPVEATPRTCPPCAPSADLRDEARGLDTIEGLLAEEGFAKQVAFLREADPNGRVRTRSRRR
jgi:hypothetical protein